MTATTSDDTLFSIIAKMLTGLVDGHLSINTPDTGFSPEISPEWIKDKPAIKAVLAKMELTEIDGSGLSYGWLPDQVGYIQLRNMTIESLSPIHAAGKAEQAMSQALTALKGAQGIILDNRWNPGGSDDISPAYARFFADKIRPVFSKETRIGDHTGNHTKDHYGPRTNIAVTPTATHGFTGPVALLNSGFTASAAEIFTMAMQELPNVTVITQPMGKATKALGFPLTGHAPLIGMVLQMVWTLF